MKLKSLLVTSIAAAGALSVAAPASATNTVTHVHYCNCGHNAGSKACGGGSTKKYSNPPSTPGNTPGTPGTTPGTPGSSGGTQVPEPGMIGMMGLGLLGVAIARRRRK